MNKTFAAGKKSMLQIDTIYHIMVSECIYEHHFDRGCKQIDLSYGGRLPTAPAVCTASTQKL